jgi:hypothetical protein
MWSGIGYKVRAIRAGHVGGGEFFLFFVFCFSFYRNGVEV